MTNSAIPWNNHLCQQDHFRRKPDQSVWRDAWFYLHRTSFQARLYTWKKNRWRGFRKCLDLSFVWESLFDFFDAKRSFLSSYKVFRVRKRGSNHVLAMKTFEKDSLPMVMVGFFFFFAVFSFKSLNSFFLSPIQQEQYKIEKEVLETIPQEFRLVSLFDVLEDERSVNLVLALFLSNFFCVFFLLCFIQVDIRILCWWRFVQFDHGKHYWGGFHQNSGGWSSSCNPINPSKWFLS